LSDLQQTRSVNKASLIEQRVHLLNLDIPPYLRYFIWLGGVLGAFVGKFSLGFSPTNQAVTDELSTAVGVTLQLVFGATIIAIVIGITVGVTTALRQYTTFDYAATFISFLFFSLPIFWVAVMLKQFGAIGFNNFLRDAVFPPTTIAIMAVAAGIVWLVVVGGPPRRRLVTFLVGAGATGAALAYISATRWLDDPSLGIVVTVLLSLGIAVIMTVLSTGWANTRSRNTALCVVGLVAVLYYPLTASGWGLFEQYSYWNIGTATLATGGFTLIGAFIGYAWGGDDRLQSVRTGGLTAFLSFLVLLLDQSLHGWKPYFDYENGRPIATIGSSTPDLVASFWIDNLDTFTHLVLPTVALVLISIASYSRYSRASLLDVMNQDYIRTARAKGLTERTVVMRHAFRNALIPITTIITLDFGALIGGAIVTETVFSWSGMGALFNVALSGTVLDVNTIMGVFLITGITAVLFNILADVIYSALDPRIRVAA
jgi:peptide/nickel transport system permease protein